MREYIVKPGDSLSLIAERELGDRQRWDEISYMNSLPDPNLIHAGQVLILPTDDPLEITITEYGQAAPTPDAKFVFNPATVALLVIGAALIFRDE